MNVSSWLRGLGAAVCLWAATALAQEVPEAPEPVVLTVLGTNYTARELGIEPDADDARRVVAMAAKIQNVVMDDYRERGKFRISEEELKEFCRKSTPSAEEAGTACDLSGLDEEIWAEWQQDDKNGREMREFATWFLMERKIQKSLFDRYGGRVALDPFNAAYAFDAARAYLAERETAGDFVICDEALRTLFWTMVRTEPNEPLLAEEAGRAAFAVHPGEGWKHQLLAIQRTLSRKLNASAP